MTPISVKLRQPRGKSHPSLRGRNWADWVADGAVRSYPVSAGNREKREFTENNGHKVTPERQKTIRECVLAKDAGGRSQTSQASIRPRSTPVSRVGSRPRVAYIVNFIKNETYGRIPKMAGRKTKLTPERQEKILKCVRAGMTYKAAAESAGIALETLCRWIARGKVESGLFHEFYESVQEALADFEWVHLKNIERSALGESKLTRQTLRYEVGEILNGQLKDGKVKYATTATKSRPRNWKRSAWLLARRFPDRWGPRAKGAAHEGEARDRQPTVIWLLPDNGRVRRMGENKTAQLLPWCINTGKSLIPLTLRFLAQKRNLLIPLELSRVMHQGTDLSAISRGPSFGTGRETANHHPSRNIHRVRSWVTSQEARTAVGLLRFLNIPQRT